MKKIIFASLIAVAIAGCNSEEKLQQEQAMLAKIDSLTTENEKNLQALSVLEQVSVYMDSIDINRKWIGIELEEGVTPENLTERMKSINDYVLLAEQKIGELEKSRSIYASQLKKLKKELGQRQQEIVLLQQTVKDVKAENAELITTVEVQEQQLTNKALEIEQKKQELALIEEKIQQLMIHANMSEAEAYYARGEAMEEAANRTKLAPKKKNETLQQALSLYLKSQDLGYEKAGDKVTELKGKLKIS